MGDEDLGDGFRFYFAEEPHEIVRTGAVLAGKPVMICYTEVRSCVA